MWLAGSRYSIKATPMSPPTHLPTLSHYVYAHLVNKYLLSTSYVPGPVLGSGYSEQQDRQGPCAQLGETEKK